MIVLSVLLLAAAAVMIPFGLASDQGDGLIWGAVASTAVALVLLAIGLRRQARSGKLASVPPWAKPEAETPAKSASDTMEAPGDGDDDGDGGDDFRRPSTTSAPAKRVGVKRAGAKKAGGAKKAAKKATGAKKAGAKKAAGTRKASAKKAGARKASAAKKS